MKLNDILEIIAYISLLLIATVTIWAAFNAPETYPTEPEDWTCIQQSQALRDGWQLCKPEK